MINIKKSIRSVDYKLYFTLLLMGLIPVIYTTVRIFILGQLPSESGFNIASQLSWVNLLYEIIQEALLLPLFFIIGKVAYDKMQLENRVKSGMLVTFGIYLILSIIIISAAKPLIIMMGQDAALIDQTTTYIRLETVANLFLNLVKFCMIVLTICNKKTYLFIILGVQMVATIIFDVFFVSNISVSLNLGVNGIAYSNIIVSVLVLAVAIYLMYKQDINIFSKQKLSFNWMKDWAKVGGISGVESLVRNLVFMFMVIRMVNVVGEQGNFWVANNFIWGWLLLPIIQLGDLVKKDSADGGLVKVNDNKYGYLLITSIIVSLWFITIPAWKPFIQYVLNVESYESVYNVALISIGFYVIFAFNNIADSIFYGQGKTQYMLYQSLIVNIGYYSIMFGLHLGGVFIPSLNSIALMFAGGIAIDGVVTLVLFLIYVRKEKNKSNDLAISKE